MKSFASGIEHAVDQLKSYMQTSQDVKYGIVTDGVVLKILDQNGKKVSDIPICQPQFLPNTKHQRTYHDLRNRIEYGYAQDIGEPESIEVMNRETGSFYT